MARTNSHPIRSRLRRPANVVAILLCLFPWPLMYLEIAVDSVSTYEDDVTLALMADALVDPNWPAVWDSFGTYWLIPCVYLFLLCIVIVFVIATGRRVRDLCILLATITWPGLFLLDGYRFVAWVLTDAPRELFFALMGHEGGEFWSEGGGTFGFIGMWVYAWVLVILPLELIDRRRRLGDEIAMPE